MIVGPLVVPHVNAPAHPVPLAVQQQVVDQPLLHRPARRHAGRHGAVGGGVQRQVAAPRQQARQRGQDEEGGGVGEEDGQCVGQGAGHLLLLTLSSR